MSDPGRCFFPLTPIRSPAKEPKVLALDSPHKWCGQNIIRAGRLGQRHFTGVLAKNTIAISMDGKGAWRENVFVERLWRSVKYKEVYLRAYESVGDARASIGRYLAFYNGGRPHSSLDRRTPDEAYFASQKIAAAA